ncbi:polyhydroxyalkanoate synthesis repressor PhaR [Arenimonas fontis]|uniref:Polyhydroxyalkanoate synthesis repressor PhaR n=1 Tax=Arenimonas fontis TaxID=2608255 RepID=A0A5B2ZE74_9GAMM|nr:polyhydroxyalkanoate synthesis repressor PhaR [Arenimonas fontis]
MAQVRIIKKYPNRRLYDTGISSYITLEDVRQLIVEGEEVSVRDARTGSDLTRVVLMQIIAEQEPQEQPVFTNELLTLAIRFHGGSQQALLCDCLERSLRNFLEQHRQASGPGEPGAVAPFRRR